MLGDFEDLNSSFECGLICQYGDVLWGIPPEDQELTDYFLYICSILFLFMLIIVWINQCMDLKFSEDERCCHRGFLFHAPICLVCFYTFVALCFLVPLVIGKENVVCTDDLDDNLTVSSYVPNGPNSIHILHDIRNLFVCGHVVSAYLQTNTIHEHSTN